MTVYELTTRPELAEEWRQVQAQEQAHTLIANRSTSAKIRFDAKVKLGDLKARRTQLEQEIVTAARVITTQRVAPKVWGRVVSENPPRPDDAYDARMGVNTDTFDRAIMPHAITSVTDGHGEPVEWDWATLAGQMTPGQYEQIIGDVLRTHMEREAVPFSLADWNGRHPAAQSSK